MSEAASSVATWSTEQRMLKMVQVRTATGVTRVVWTAVVMGCGKQMEKLPHYHFSWMTLRTGEDTLIWKRRLWIALCGGIVLEEALDLSSDRLLNNNNKLVCTGKIRWSKVPKMDWILQSALSVQKALNGMIPNRQSCTCIAFWMMVPLLCRWASGNWHSPVGIYLLSPQYNSFVQE